MSSPPITFPESTTIPRSIPSLTQTSSISTQTQSSFTAPPLSSRRRKPIGLDISQSIAAKRKEALSQPLSSANHSDISQALERLQVSSRSSSSGGTGSIPTTPTNLSVSDSSGSVGAGVSGRKRSTGERKKGRDKDGFELVKDEELEVICDLGAGNGGTVTKCWNKKRLCVMARKLVLVDAKPSVRKQILRELQIMNDCDSPYIVGYYGCFPADVHVGIVMEFMDAGSLDHIYRRNGAVPIQFVGKVAEAVLRGLMYLYDVHRIIHRDIKPSNILANTEGEIKICDFGVSGELINSIANTFVGTSTYMSPERIQGAPYTIKSDIWSLGISLIELALGRFPFSDNPNDEEGEDPEPEYDPDPTLPLNANRPNLTITGRKKPHLPPAATHNLSILDLLQHIVNEPAPKLISSKRSYPEEAKRFVEGCLDKDPRGRTSPGDLLASDWIVKSTVTKEDLKAWAQSLDST